MKKCVLHKQGKIGIDLELRRRGTRRIIRSEDSESFHIEKLKRAGACKSAPDLGVLVEQACWPIAALEFLSIQ